jgi:hypothetical protein
MAAATCTPDTRPACTACPHVHAGPVLGGVCLDCDCPRREMQR